MTTEFKGSPITGLASKFYDLGNKFAGFGERFRSRILDEASLKEGEAVLDCGCGTGMLTLLAKRRVGPKGQVHGVDISKDQLDVGRNNARRDGLQVEFHDASIDELPFPDKNFDAIFSTLMLHHVPKEVKTGAFREMRRVLRPNGRIVIADFGLPAHAWGWVAFAPILLMCITHITARDNLSNRLPTLMSEAGLKVKGEKIIKEVVHIFKAE